jgi:hypothetical protein
VELHEPELNGGVREKYPLEHIHEHILMW